MDSPINPITYIADIVDFSWSRAGALNNRSTSECLEKVSEKSGTHFHFGILNNLCHCKYGQRHLATQTLFGGQSVK